MCQKAAATAASLMQAIEPTLKSLLSYTGLVNTPDGEAAIAAYNAALTALQGWQSGTVSHDVLQLIGDFQIVLNTLPLPPGVQMLSNIILAGIEAVIGVVTANSPAPATPTGATASVEETTALYQAHVAHQTTIRVAALVPEFRRSIWHSASSQYNKAWNGAIESNEFPPSMKT